MFKKIEESMDVMREQEVSSKNYKKLVELKNTLSEINNILNDINSILDSTK